MIYGELIGKDVRKGVILLDASDFKTELTGVAAADVTVGYSSPKNPGKYYTKTLNSATWKELGNGLYDIIFTAEELGNVPGEFKFYCIDSTPSLPYYGSFELMSNEEYYLIKYIFASVASSGPNRAKPSNLLKGKLSVILRELIDKLPDDLKGAATESAILDSQKSVETYGSRSITTKTKFDRNR